MRRSILVLTALAAACTSSTEPIPGSTVRRPATLEHFGDPAIISSPSSARVGVPIDVVFTTYGGGCISRAETDLEVVALDAQIRPFQDEYIPRANEACTAELRVESNTVTLTFNAAGTARIRVFGRKMPGNNELVLVRLVTVDP